MQVIGEEEPMAESDSESDEDQIITVRVAPTADLQQNTTGTQHDIAGDESPSEDHDHQDTGAQLPTCYRTTRGQHSNLQHLPRSVVLDATTKAMVDLASAHLNRQHLRQCNRLWQHWEPASGKSSRTVDPRPTPQENPRYLVC